MAENSITSKCELLLIGGSAGSLEVLLKILPYLPTPTFSIVIVVHRKHTEDMTLEDLIAIKTNIPVKEIEDKVALLPGHLYIAPSDYHLLFEKNKLLSLDTSEKINYSRPSIDVSFESAADVYGKALVAILLSGANADGTNGLITIKKAGGTIIVQQPHSAEMPFMPNNAIENCAPDYILDIPQLLAFISALK